MNGHTQQRKRLSDIINGGADSLRAAWNSTAAAEDFKPLPADTYITRIIAGELSTAKTGTPTYKLTFRVLEGEHAGRLLWADVWLTPTAMPMAKRDLGKLGITSIDQLETPLPRGIRCRVKVVLRRDDDGTEFNRVKSFDVIGIDPPDTDPTADPDFAPLNPTDTPKQPSVLATPTIPPVEQPSLLPSFNPPSAMKGGI